MQIYTLAAHWMKRGDELFKGLGEERMMNGRWYGDEY